MEGGTATTLLSGSMGRQRAALRAKHRGAVRVRKKTMRTYTHGVIGYLLYAKRPRHEQRLAVIGGIVPDVFLALGFVAHYGAIVTQSPRVEALHNFLHHSTLHTV